MKLSKNPTTTTEYIENKKNKIINSYKKIWNKIS